MATFLECGPFSARDGEGRILFDGVSVSLADGQCVVIEGPSGSGKSTLLRHLAALAYAPDADHRLDGKSYRGSEMPGWRAPCARPDACAGQAAAISGRGAPREGEDRRRGALRRPGRQAGQAPIWIT